MALSENFKNSNIKTISATIANGQTKTGIIDLSGTTMSGFYTPSALTGTSFTFEASYDGINFFPIKDETNSTITYTVSPNNFYRTLATSFYGVRLLKIVSNSAEAADRDLIIQPYAV